MHLRLISDVVCVAQLNSRRPLEPDAARVKQGRTTTSLDKIGLCDCNLKPIPLPTTNLIQDRSPSGLIVPEERACGNVLGDNK